MLQLDRRRRERCFGAGNFLSSHRFSNERPHLAGGMSDDSRHENASENAPSKSVKKTSQTGERARTLRMSSEEFASAR
jgi:hypothetical protein